MIALRVLHLLSMDEFIRHEGGKWVVYSHTGKKLGSHDTKEKAQAQLAAVEISKKERGESSSEAYQLSVIQFPSGKFGYAGSVPKELAVTKADGSALSDSEFADYKNSSNPSMVAKSKGYKTLSFDSKDAALKFASDKGFKAEAAFNASAEAEKIYKSSQVQGFIKAASKKFPDYNTNDVAADDLLAKVMQDIADSGILDNYDEDQADELFQAIGDKILSGLT